MAVIAVCHEKEKTAIPYGACEPETGVKGVDKRLHPADTAGCNNMCLHLLPGSSTRNLV